MSNRFILSADIGGSHITAAVFVEKSDGFAIKAISGKNIDSKQSKDLILQQWVTVFRDLISDFSHCCIVLAMPAPFDYANGICQILDQGKFIHLFGVDLKMELAQRLEISHSQIYFVNDAKAFLMGESKFGKVSGYENILGLTLGTGLGSSQKLQEEIFDAELWSSKFKDGIAEDYLGTAWFIGWCRDNLFLKVEGVKEILENPDLLQMALPAFGIFSKNLAEFILMRFEEMPIDAIVLGGNISRANDFFLEETVSILVENQINVPIFISDFGDRSALYGAASRFFGQKVLLGLDQVS